jgi:muconate cycloisomerase
VAAIVRAFEGRADVIADINQGWDEATAMRWLPVLAEQGLAAIEQPLPAANVGASARLQAMLPIPIIADESIDGPASALELARSAAALAFSLKPNRDGGITSAAAVAAIAEAAGIACYGGTMIETSIGTAALAALYSSVGQLAMGTELFGPLRLAEDLATEPLRVRDGMLQVPDRPGLGVDLDEERLAKLARAN